MPSNRTILLAVNNSWNILNFRMAVVNRLQQMGYQVTALSPDDAAAAKLAATGIRHIPVAIDSKGLSPLADLRLLAAYRRALRRERPAALLAWTVKPNVYASLAARSLGIPVINNVSGLGTAFIRESWLTRLVSGLYRAAFARAATVFFQNPEDRALFTANRLVEPARTELLPGSGIDTARFAPSAAASADDPRFTFLLVGRILRDKGAIEFVEAARRVRQAHPDAVFQMLGAIDADNRTAVPPATVAGWVDEGLIVHLGQLDDVRPAIAAADCVVLPSYREGLPRALLEGAAMAKPLIASRVPGCIEIARDGVNALLCQVRDADSLADAMERMLRLSSAERAAMGAAGRRIVETEFDERIVADRYQAALERAINQGSQSNS